MANHYQILIIGGGNAGLSVASQLLRKRSSLNIAIVDPSEKHYYQLYVFNLIWTFPKRVLC